MELCLNFICDRLPRELAGRLLGQGDRRKAFPRPIPYIPGDRFEPDKLYIVSAKHLPADASAKGAGIICIGKTIPRAWQLGASSVLWIAADISFSYLFQEVQRIYDKVDQWDHALLAELVKEQDFNIRRVIQLGAEMLENPLRMMSPSTQYIFFTTVRGTPEESLTVEFTEKPGFIPIAYANEMRKVCAQEQLIRVPYISAMMADGKRSYCFNLFPLNFFMGCVSFTEEYRPFRESDFPLADHFFSLFQQAFLKDSRQTKKLESAEAVIFRKLISREPLDAEEKAAIQLNTGEQWIFFELRERKNVRSMPLDYMFATLNGAFSGTVFSALYLNTVGGLIRVRSGKLPSDTVLPDEFEKLVDMMGYVAGMSNSFQDLQKMDDYSIQAHYAASRCVDLYPEHTVLPFREYALRYILSCCCEKNSVSSLCSAGVRALWEYDKKKNTEYLQTLQTYLDNEMSLSRTSAALFIHRSSLLKRLERIKKMTGDDLDDPDVRLYYRLFFRLVKLQQANVN